MKTAQKLATALALELESMYETLPYRVVYTIEEFDDLDLALEIYNLRELSYEILTRTVAGSA